VDYTALPPEHLANACRESGNELAWAEFIHRFQSLIASVAFRVCRQWGENSSEAVDDLVQETYLKLCAGGLDGLRNFKSAHEDAIYGYIKVFTANLVHDHFKAARSQKRGGGIIVDSIDGQDYGTPPPRGSALTCLERDVLIQQIDACLSLVASGPDLERDRRIFWLHYRVGLPASAIAGLPTVKLSTKGVESTLFRLTKQVRQRLVSSRSEANWEKGFGQRNRTNRSEHK
jgi:RNA polymerase sigma-70 factor (ECF subfamily)